MKRAIIAAALCVGLLATTASTCTQPVIDTGKHCAKVAGSGVVNDILPKVNEVLGCSISDPAAIPVCVGAGLADLGVQFGIVLCALEQIESRKFVTPGDPDVGTRQRRAKAYLEARPQAFLRGRGPAPRLAHNQKAACSIHAPATFVSGAVVAPASALTNAVDGRKAREASGRTTLILAGLCPSFYCVADPDRA